MLIENLTIQRRLQRIVAGFPGDTGLHEELMQEAMIHLWLMEEQDPSKNELWYLQSCRLYLQNFLRRGEAWIRSSTFELKFPIESR